MTPTLRPGLKDLPLRMLDLPIDPERGWPVPWFVDYVDGKPEFRTMDFRKWKRATREKLCWCCGQKLGANIVFVLGPMCGITRVTSEPPNHRDCARWAARFCPFLSRPRMVRRDDSDLKALGAIDSLGGIGLDRNPGVTLLWTARSYKVFHPKEGESLIEVGEADAWEWWAEGRAATREEVQESIRTGLPFLEAEAQQQKGGMEELHRRVIAFESYLPA